MIAESILRLVRFVHYPENELSPDAAVQTLVIDDYRLTAEVRGGQLYFGWELEETSKGRGSDPHPLEELAGYAAGRLLAEKATLAYDPEKNALLLWQAVPTTAGTAELAQTLEDFVNSCDWWSTRLNELKAQHVTRVPEMVIRP